MLKAIAIAEDQDPGKFKPKTNNGKLLKDAVEVVKKLEFEHGVVERMLSREAEK